MVRVRCAAWIACALVAAGGAAHGAEPPAPTPTAEITKLYDPHVLPPGMSDTPTAPESAATLDPIRAWIAYHSGYGVPRDIEAELGSGRVFASWNIPWSGRNTTDYWIYCRRASAWHLL